MAQDRRSGRGSLLAWVPLVIGLCLVAFPYIARAISPEQWGGPNIGGGILVFVGIGFSVLGLIIVVLYYTSRRRR